MISRITAILALLVILPGAVHRALTAGNPLLAREVDSHMAGSGVDSPVTAVLLNFRAFDTLLETTILAAAAIGVLALQPPRKWGYPGPQNSLLPNWFIPRLAPLIGLLVVYLWWAGSSRPGGAFQAGAALTGIFLLLYLAGHIGNRRLRSTVLIPAVTGPLLFLGIGLSTPGAVSPFLDYPEAWSGTLILVIEAALTASTGGALALLALSGGEEP